MVVVVVFLRMSVRTMRGACHRHTFPSPLARFKGPSTVISTDGTPPGCYPLVWLVWDWWCFSPFHPRRSGLVVAARMSPSVGFAQRSHTSTGDR
uniref:Putative secreted protein n=1 Tax=Anopheles darlingi TaxID=43151 RepID=A0A2M4DM54_ANODA